MKKILIMSAALALFAVPALAATSNAMTALQTLQAMGIAPATPAAPVTPALPTQASAMEQLKNYALTNYGGTPAAATPTGTIMDQIKGKAVTSAAMYVVDSNRDGMVSKPEMNALDNKMFDLADSNKDGQLSQAELQTLSANMTRVMALLK